MQKTVSGVRGQSALFYRERLSPSLWVIVSAAVAAPMAALVIAPIDTTVALVAGAVVGVAIVALLIAGSPVVQVRDGILIAGRAHIDVGYTGEATVLTGDDARHARGPGLHPRSWHVIRGGIDGIVIVEITDLDDPAPSWVLSTRTPDRFAAALRRAQATRRTPSR
ncbi:DUF3093 domain-containing protein [uncultured Microbacterium sp.]|uniref:DUF3093 domain-containing protein n=1 Tax=uncultured Microbacterium sp. TaxID=191216 RepID=UPI0028D5F7AA|nr:DUF3093 domain-containing protein [uncultured Microbacterium sp.]